MATLNICGFELNSALEVIVSVGTPTWQTTTKRTGAYALRVTSANANAKYVMLGGFATNGGNANMGRTAQTWYTFYFRLESLPSGGTAEFASVTNSGVSAAAVRLECTTLGAVRLVGTTTSSTIATVTTGVWYRMDLRVTSNGTAGAAIDGGTEQTVTANNVTQDELILGKAITLTNGIDFYYDDALISDSGFPGAGSVRVLWPIGAGASAGWTNGTGSTFAEVDETTGHDTDTSYISASATQDNTFSTFDMTSCATAGVRGNVNSVKVVAIARTESTTGTSGVGVRLRSGSTNSDTVEREWTTTYAIYSKVLSTNPDGGGAWTTTAVDGIECGVFAGTIAQIQRCTSIAAMVWSDGVTQADVPVGLLKLTPVASNTSKSAAVPVVGVDLLGTSFVTLVPVPVVSLELLGIESSTKRDAAVPAGLIRLLGVAPTVNFGEAVPVVSVEFLGVAPDVKHDAAVPIGLVEFLGVVPEAGPEEAAVSTRQWFSEGVQTYESGTEEFFSEGVQFSENAVAVGIIADVPVGLVEFVSLSPDTSHSAPVLAGLVKLTSPGLVETGTAAVPAVSVEFLGVTSGSIHAAPVPPVIVKFLPTALASSHSTTLAAGSVKLTSATPATIHSAPVPSVSVHFVVIEPTTAKAAAVAVVGVDFLGVASAVVKAAAVPADVVLFSAPELVEPSQAAVPPARLRLTVIAPTSLKAAPAGLGSLEFVGLAPSVPRVAPVPFGAVDWLSTQLGSSKHATLPAAGLELVGLSPTAPIIANPGFGRLVLAPVVPAVTKSFTLLPARVEFVVIEADITGPTGPPKFPGGAYLALAADSPEAQLVLAGVESTPLIVSGSGPAAVIYWVK